MVRKVEHPGFEVHEGHLRGGNVVIIDAHLHFETQWRCPRCKSSFRKTGKHHGHQTTCRSCKVSLWLRITTTA
jgi:transposase-like protein